MIASTRLRGTIGFGGLSTQTLMDLLEVPRCNRFTARNNETMPRPRFADAAPCHLSTGCCEELTSYASPSTHKGISRVASFLPLSGHSGHGRNCCSLDPVVIDPKATLEKFDPAGPNMLI